MIRWIYLIKQDYQLLVQLYQNIFPFNIYGLKLSDVTSIESSHYSMLYVALQRILLYESESTNINESNINEIKSVFLSLFNHNHLCYLVLAISSSSSSEKQALFLQSIKENPCPTNINLFSLYLMKQNRFQMANQMLKYSIQLEHEDNEAQWIMRVNEVIRNVRARNPIRRRIKLAIFPAKNIHFFNSICRLLGSRKNFQRNVTEYCAASFCLLTNRNFFLAYLS